MQEAGLRSDDLGDMGKEGDHIMFDLALDGIDTREVETRIPSLLPDFFRGLLRNYPKLGHGVSRMRLDFEPEAVPRLGVPDRRYFGSGVARDHQIRLLLRAPAQLRGG